MQWLKRIVSWTWRLAVAGAGHAMGLVIGSMVALALGLEPPRDISGGSTTAALLLLAGGAALALGLAAMASGLTGTRWQRCLILGMFAFVVNGVGTALELSQFSTLGGEVFSIVSNVPAAFLCALLVAVLFPAPSGAASGVDRTAFGLGAARAAPRLLLCFLAFPVFYFVIGMMIAPIVLPAYEQIDFIVVPPLATILVLLACRSTLFLLVSIPVIVRWGLSRGGLAIALAAGHFTAIGLSGLVQATFFPPVLRWTHGVEILVTSIGYGAVLAWLLFTPSGTTAPAARVDGRRPAES